MINQIESQITWLKKNISSNDLVGKLQKVEELAHNTYYLATLVAEYYSKMSHSEYMFKSSVAAYVSSSKDGVARAEAMAKAEYKEFWKEAVEAETMYKRLQLALNQCNIIIEQVRQSCAHLRNELKHQQ